MQGNHEVIKILNEVLAAEITAINQYFVHAKMGENWGYGKLYEFNEENSIEEMKHAEKLIERILFLEGIPFMNKDKLNIGKTVQEQMGPRLCPGKGRNQKASGRYCSLR